LNCQVASRIFWPTVKVARARIAFAWSWQPGHSWNSSGLSSGFTTASSSTVPRRQLAGRAKSIDTAESFFIADFRVGSSSSSPVTSCTVPVAAGLSGEPGNG
jgi:hypothetical protein